MDNEIINEWIEKQKRTSNPDLEILSSFHLIVYQYLKSPNSKATKKLLDSAMECVGEYLSVNSDRD